MSSRNERLSSVAAAARILRSFDGHSTQLGISQLGRQVGISKSSAHRVVWTLVEEGLLEKVNDTGLFRLTSRMRSLGASAETAQLLHEAATLPLDRLRAVTDGTLQIAILEGVDVLYVERREGPGAIMVFRAVGARNAAYRTSSGKLLLAFLPTEERNQAVAAMKLRPRTARTITSRHSLLTELATIRRQGYAENRGESEPQMCSVAAPIRDRLGRVVASVSVALHVRRVEEGLPHLVRPVVSTAERISLGLGWSH